MVRWLILLAGPLLWAAHFGLIYAVASISIQAVGESTPLARGLIGGSGLAFVGVLALLCLSLRRGEDEVDRFWRSASIAGAVIGIVAILWQSLPALLPPA
ncbi:MAG TPA: hypothetical protein VEA80_06870 [Vitreimonas sp.]|uniref:hypothetical protein n=1 Tax=Vitreimonas sp. TaxID=3069702 RepID=UPI002D684A7C|nr:hypothetical protein [Vitreimonas sp.]HYD87177.1 hypothetical protein [Vitreimonas sp.]